MVAGPTTHQTSRPPSPRGPVPASAMPVTGGGPARLAGQLTAAENPGTLLADYQAAQAATGVGWSYLAAINFVETDFGRVAGPSSAGAQGPMQFMPATWAAYGTGDVNDPHDAILGAAKYLKANGAPNDMQKALYAYNHSQAYVDAIAGYALVMKDDANALRGYHGWQVYYSTIDGTSWLKVGWKKE